MIQLQKSSFPTTMPSTKSSRACSILLLIILATTGPDTVSAEHNCFTAGQVTGIIFVTSFTTFFALTGISLLLWYFYRSRTIPNKNSILNVENGMEKSGKTVYNDREYETENKAVEVNIMPSFTDKMTSCNSLISKCQDDLEEILGRNQKIHPKRQRQCLRSQSTHSDFPSYGSVNILKDVVRCLLEKDTSALGFQIAQRSDGICISHVEPDGPAHRSGNIFVGDRIKELTITFEKMPISDALTILSCASTYKIRLELERAIIGDTIHPGCTATTKYQNISSTYNQQFSSLCKSHSTSDLALPLQEVQQCGKAITGGSFMSNQKYQLPRQTTAPITDEKVTSTAFQIPLPSGPAPELTGKVESIPVMKESVISGKTIIVTEESLPSSVSVLKRPRISSDEVSLQPKSFSTVMTSESVQKANNISNSSASDRSQQLQSTSRISSPSIKRPVLSLAAEENHKVEEIKHNGYSEFVERSHFMYSKANTKDEVQKGSVEFCELIEPKRRSIVIEFEEEQEQIQEQVTAKVAKTPKCNGACSETQIEMYQADSAVANNSVPMNALLPLGATSGVTVDAENIGSSTEGDAQWAFENASQIPDNTGIGIPHNSPAVVETPAGLPKCANVTGGTFNNYSTELQSSNSASHAPHPASSIVSNGSTVTTSIRSASNMFLNDSPVMDSPRVPRKVINPVVMSAVGQKSPKRSRLRKISSECATMDGTVAGKEIKKPDGTTEDVKGGRSSRSSSIPQRSPKLSPKLQSHIPIVARTASTKSKNKFSKVENNKIVDMSASPTPNRTADNVCKDDINGASLYIAKKEALRKTFLPYSKSSKSEEVDLSKERRARLDANQALLERQQEELRALGILP